MKQKIGELYPKKAFLYIFVVYTWRAWLVSLFMALAVSMYLEIRNLF